MPKRLAVLFILLALSALAFAGDVAAFVNLGFSEDGRYFMFAQYGIDSSGRSFAEIYTVDNQRNDYAPKGQLKSVSNAPLDLGQDGSGLFYTLLYENSGAVRRFGLDHLRQGRLLYVLLNGEEAKPAINFRDFKTDRDYSVSLCQQVQEGERGPRSSFSLDVDISLPDGSTLSFSGGSPEIKRQGVMGYLIRRVILSPDARYLILVVEKKQRDKEGLSSRYMVESIKIK